MNIDRRNKKFSELDLKIAKKYRVLLYETHCYIQNIIRHKV